MASSKTLLMYRTTGASSSPWLSSPSFFFLLLFLRVGLLQAYQLFLQEYSNPASNNTTAVGRMSIKSADGTYATEYTFILEAPKENVSQIEERYISESEEGLEVVLAKSWWTCILGQLPQIGQECQSGVATCGQNATSIVGYIGCVATNCGPSFSRHSACCNCGCTKWCRWAFGCCQM